MKTKKNNNFDQLKSECVTDNIFGVVFIYYRKVDGTEMITDISDEAISIFGVDKEDINENISKLWKRCHPDDIAGMDKSITESAKNLSYWKHEWRFNHPELGWRKHYGYGNPLKLEDGTVKWNSTILDITNLMNYQVKLNESNERFSLVNRATNDAIFDYDVKNNVLELGESFERIFGHKSGVNTISIKTLNSFIHPEDYKVKLKATQAFIKDEKRNNYIGEYRFKHNNGKYVHVEENSFVVRDEKNDPIRVVGVIKDITKQKEEKAHLELLESVIENSNDAILILNKDKEIIFANNSVVELLGYGRETLINKPFVIFEKNIPITLDTEIFYNEIDEGKTSFTATKFIKNNGDECWISISANPVRSGKFLSNWIVTVSDQSSIILTNTQDKLIARMSKVYSQESTLKACVNIVKDEIAKSSNFDIIEFWLTNFEDNKLALFEHYTRDAKLNELYDVKNAVKQFNIGEGLPGITWQKKYVEIISELGSCEYFVRRKIADKLKLVSGIGIPLLANNEIIGVLLLLSKRKINTEEQSFIWNLNLGKFLGQEIHRKKQEERFKQLFDYSPEMLAIAGTDGYFRKVNSAFKETLGYSENELLSQPFENFVHPDDKEKSKEQFQILITEKPIKYFENRYKTKDGEWKWVSWSSSEVLPDERLIYAYGKDITELKKKQELLDRVTDLSKIGGFEIDLEKKDVIWSDKAKQIAGIDNNYDPSLDNWLNLYREGYSRGEITCAIEHVLKTGEGWDLDLEIITQTGEEKWVRSVGEVKDFSTSSKKIIGSIQDIDDLKRIEIQLSEKTDYLITLSQINTTLLNMEDWRNSLQVCMQLIGNIIQSDRTYFFKYYKDNELDEFFISQEVEWVKSGIRPQIDDEEILKIPENKVTEFLKPLKEGEIYSKELKEIKDKFVRGLFRNGDISSIILLPVFVKKEFFGFVGCDNCATVRKWTDDENEFLLTSIQNISVALEAYTVNKNLEASLIEKENILESIDDGFFVLDSQLRINYWNNSAERITGFEKSEVIDKAIDFVFEKTDITNFIDFFRGVLETNESKHIEFFYHQKNAWLDFSIYPNDGELTVYFVDITEKKDIFNKLHESNERFRMLSRSANDAIWDWDLENDTLYWGKGFSRLFGYHLSKLEPTLEFWNKNIHKDDVKKVVNALKTVLNSKDENKVYSEYKFRKADGSYAEVVDRGSVIRGLDGKPIRIVGAMADVTKQKEYQKSLEELNYRLKLRANELAMSNKELEQFAYVASHDLQEPLRMITSFLERLDEKYADELDDKAKKYIYFANDGAKRMRRIILDLLTYSRVNESEEKPKKLNLNKFIDGILSINRSVIDSKKSQIKVDKLPSILMEETPLRLIFTNLIINAIKYTEEGKIPKVHIKHKDNADYWEFSVSDNGIGIDPDYYEKIFLIFQRLHSKEKYEGTGIGLAIVKKVIDKLGGEIWIESNKDQGSIFNFKIPKNNKFITKI